MKTSREKPKLAVQKRSRSASPAETSPPKSRTSALKRPVSTTSDSSAAHWTFLTNHSHVLAILAWNPSIVLRQVALQVGITERAVQRIIADLEAAGVIEREKVGRQNHYLIRLDLPLRHPIESHRTVGELLAVIQIADSPKRR
jgi:predicted HTH transcriptional regulator